MIYLYVKTHNKTGKKYFGKTTREKTLSRYRGSGKLWLKHIKKHGYDVTTEIIATFDDSQERECAAFALKFSVDNNIVESDCWANLKEENGLDGAPKGVKFSDEHREKIRQARLGKCYNDFDSETRKKMSEASSKKVKARKEANNFHFAGSKGSKFASNRNKQRVKNGSHNFVGFVCVVDKSGKRQKISCEEFWSQTGNKQDWKYVQQLSKEAKERLKTAKDEIK